MKTALFSLFALASAHFASAAVDLGASTSGTPYDRYMSPVRTVLNQLGGEETSMERVRRLMSQGRNFRYSYTDPYVAATPEKTAAIRAGDCKAKSLWLCDQLGDSSVRYVIGKARRSSKISHAWVMWEHNSKWWILDCTNTSVPIPADRVSASEYIAFYSYTKSGPHRRTALSSMPASNVASKAKAPVASSSSWGTRRR